MASLLMEGCVTGVSRTIMIDGIEYKDLTFEQFTTWAMRVILDALIIKGMRGVKESLYSILPTYSEFQKAKKDAR
jgi:phage pi2 protein 07